MNGKLANNRLSKGRILFWAVCILFALAALTSWAVSGVYAKYVSSATLNGSAVAGRLGISDFQLLEHKAVPYTSAEMNESIEKNSLYKLDTAADPVSGNTYGTVTPGTVIPKDPFIEVKVESEVNFELFVEVTESYNRPAYEDADGKEHSALIYELTDDWEFVEELVEGKRFLYRFTGELEADDETSPTNGIFLAGKTYTFSGDKVISILKDNKIRISEHYDGETYKSFSLTFTAYFEQTLKTGKPESTESGD